MRAGKRGYASAASYPMTPRHTSPRPLIRAAALLLGGVLLGCVTTPVTGKRAFLPFPVSQDLALGAQAYTEVLSSEEPVTSGPEKETVERVMDRLVGVADDKGYDWEVTLLSSDTVNAFALPGGKMAVYTGILPVCADAQGKLDNGLAVVMGHEIGHVVARHGMQRMTQQVGLGLAMSMLDAGQYQDLVGELVNVTLTLPFGRAHESEADHIGLVYMARAGYDPRGAIDFWTRMSQMGGQEPPEFLSTHPSHETRIADLQALMPEALKEYEQARGVRP